MDVNEKGGAKELGREIIFRIYYVSKIFFSRRKNNQGERAKTFIFKAHMILILLPFSASQSVLLILIRCKALRLNTYIILIYNLQMYSV